MTSILIWLQASPHDPENFPFVVLGNKTDVDGGNSRVVRSLDYYGFFCLKYRDTY